MDLELAGMHFYVTGISSGIGHAIATTLMDEGAQVSGCARSPVADAAFRFELCDVLDESAMARSVNAAGEARGRLDGVVACAGVGSSGSAIGTTNADWLAQAELKLLSVMNLVRPAEPWLRRAPKGVVCLINGITAHHPESDMAATSAARAAAASLGRSLAEELAPDGVRVCTVNLGAIRTDRQAERWRTSGASATMSFADWEAREVERRSILLGRFGTAEEAAAVATFLLSPRASYLTGTSVDVSGGAHGRP